MSRTCKLCNKVFPNGKSWGGHIRACYKQEKEKEKYYWSSSESESEFQGDGDGAESSNKVSVQPINLMEHLPHGWSKNTKRRRDSTEQSCTDDDDDILKMAAIKLLSLPSVITESKQKGIGGKVLARYQNKFAQHLSVNKKPMKINNAYTEEKRAADLVEGQKRSYVCRECGLVFDNFQGLGGHLAAHNRKRLREKVGESDLVGKGGNVIITGTAPARKEYKCNLCGKSFQSGQALGGHKSYHSSGAYTGYSSQYSRKALLVEHSVTAPTELINHSGQALVGPKSNVYRAANSIADMGYNNHYASSRDETSSIVVISHSNPPPACTAEVSSPNPPLANVLDLNMPPDEGLWGF